MKTKKQSFFTNKKVLIIVATAILFVSAIYLNIRVNNNAKAVTDPSGSAYTDNNGDDMGVSGTAITGSSYFTAFRENRKNTRDTEIAYLDAIISDEKTDAETLTEAQEQKLSITECMEVEFTIESLITAKGFTDVAVTFHKGSINVIVDADELSEEEVAQILEIVLRESGESAENVKVSTCR